MPSVNPPWYNAFMEAQKIGCLGEVIAIAALSSTQNTIFVSPHLVRYAAATEHEQFANPISDHITELTALHQYIYYLNSDGDVEAWCYEVFLSKEVIGEVLALRERLVSECTRLFRLRNISFLRYVDEEYDARIRKALARGFYHNAAVLESGEVYRTLDNHPVGLPPKSALVNMGWEWVIYHEMNYSGRQHMDRRPSC